mgnify:CR=1 FL=1
MNSTPIPTIKKPSNRIKHIPGKRLGITKKMILESQGETLSAFAAARWLGVHYNTYKKYAKKYGIFEQHKNQAGDGISKPRPIDPNSAKWKYFDPNNIPKHKGYVYFLGLNKKDSIDFIKKWKCNPIKVGRAKNIVERVNEVLGKYYPDKLPNTKMWKDWLEKAKPVGWITLWTHEEADVVERAFHYLLKEYRMDNAGMAREMFDVSWKTFYEVEEKIYNIRNKDLGKNEVL